MGTIKYGRVGPGNERGKFPYLAAPKGRKRPKFACKTSHFFYLEIHFGFSTQPQSSLRAERAPFSARDAPPGQRAQTARMPFHAFAAGVLAPFLWRLAEDGILSAANDANSIYFDESRKPVEWALSESQNRINDCPVKIYSWKTAQSNFPGSHYCIYITLSGQDFYTLTPEWIDELRKTQKHWESRKATTSEKG